jgi:hypothetical protein
MSPMSIERLVVMNVQTRAMLRVSVHLCEMREAGHDSPARVGLFLSKRGRESIGSSDGNLCGGWQYGFASTPIQSS